MRILTAAALCGLLAAGNATAKVSTDQAARLGKDLTPVGAEKAGNKDGSIPAWEGGLSKAPACFKPGGRYCDPFTDDKALYTITPANVAQYEKLLTPGQRAMFQKHATYKMVVYPSRRTLALPQHVYDATKANATRAELGGNGEAVDGAAVGIPFPFPANGHEVVWNHKLRYRGEGGRHYNNQFAVTTSGSYNQVTLREDIALSYSQKNATAENLDNVAIYFLQIVTAPTRLAGTITLVHETMDQVKEPRRAWPYNSYKLGSGDYKYADIMKKGHINQDLPRYEVHRVWVVDSVTKPGTTHLYKRRTFYVDEDTWGILLADVYDRRDQLWRWQEAHPIIYYDRPYIGGTGETIYDLQSMRYLSQNFSNEHPEFSTDKYVPSYFEPANVSKQAIR